MTRLIWFWAILPALTLACGGTAESRREVAAVVQELVSAARPPAYVSADSGRKDLWKQVRAFYERREQQPAWVNGTVPRREMGDLIKALRAADDEGLDPDLYGTSLLEAWREEASEGFVLERGFEPVQAGRLDVWLTYLYLRYASDLASGVGDLAHADRTWRIRPDPFDAGAHLDAALEQRRIADSLLELRPENPQYDALRRALADHRARAAAGGWPAIPAGLGVRPGVSSTGVTTLASRLEASGDYKGRLPRDLDEPMAFDEALQDAVKRFQRRHGLADDGIVGRATIAQLNVPIEQRIQQIALNLERWRWLPRKFGDRFILINIPEFQLEVWDGQRVPLAMRVVVGRPDTPTPVFNDEMSHLVFSPFWNVPPAIAEGETLPAFVQDPDFLARNNMEVVDANGNPIDASEIDLEDPTTYRFRQRPGRQNSLGLVKFMFPNEYHVYLHDTPSNSLFERVHRSFSHGCVRVEQPVQLAEYLLRDQSGWTRERIEDAMHGGEERTVKLTDPVPVFLGYWTARVPADGALQFRRDIYGIDRRQTSLMADRLARVRKVADAAVASIAARDAPSRPLANGRSTD